MASNSDFAEPCKRPNAAPRLSLGAILLNPPTTSGAATMRHLSAAARALHCDNLVIANMFPTESKSVIEMSAIGQDPQTWISARPSVSEVANSSDVLIVAWGVRGLTGRARTNMRDQIEWFVGDLSRAEQPVWTVGGEPRHPSRWHQYVSDKHGRAGSGTLVQRLGRVLVQTAPQTIRYGT